MRTAPPSTLAVTVWPRSRPSKMSFSICLDVVGLSGVRGSGTATVGGTARCDLACEEAGVCAREERATRGLIHCTKKYDPAAVPAKSPIAAPRDIDSRRVLLDRGGAGVVASARARIETVESPSSECGVVLMFCEPR